MQRNLCNFLDMGRKATPSGVVLVFLAPYRNTDGLVVDKPSRKAVLIEGFERKARSVSRIGIMKRDSVTQGEVQIWPVRLSISQSESSLSLIPLPTPLSSTIHTIRLKQYDHSSCIL
jgi:hypothetical protein